MMREDVKKAVLNHHTNLRSAVKAFRCMVEGDMSTAPASFQLEARQGMWKLKGIRQRMDKLMSEMAASFARGEEPEDFDGKLAKLSIAMYLLEKTDQMLEAALRDNGTAMVALFVNAHAAVSHILDEGYFSRTDGQVIDSYLDGETAITACAACTGVRLLALHHAVEDYKMRVAAQIESLMNAAA